MWEWKDGAMTQGGSVDESFASLVLMISAELKTDPRGRPRAFQSGTQNVDLAILQASSTAESLSDQAQKDVEATELLWNFGGCAKCGGEGFWHKCLCARHSHDSNKNTDHTWHPSCSTSRFRRSARKPTEGISKETLDARMSLFCPSSKPDLMNQCLSSVRVERDPVVLWLFCYDL